MRFPAEATLSACFVPTAATRSGRCFRRWRHSHRSPSLTPRYRNDFLGRVKTLPYEKTVMKLFDKSEFEVEYLWHLMRIF